MCVFCVPPSLPREGRITYTLDCAPGAYRFSTSYVASLRERATITGFSPVATGSPIGQNGRNVPHSIHCQHRLNGLYHLRVDLLPAKRAAEAQVKRTPKIFRDDSASLLVCTVLGGEKGSPHPRRSDSGVQVRCDCHAQND